MAKKSNNTKNTSINETAWMRALHDLPPASCMHTTRGVAIAAKAQWQQREPVEEKLLDYAHQWHAAGWKPREWWALATTLTLCRSLEPNSVHSGRRIVQKHEQHPREFSLDIKPEQWQGWQALAAENGALRATLALLMDAGMSLDTALMWAKKPVRISDLTYLQGVKFTSMVDGTPIVTPDPPHWQIIAIDPFKSPDEH